MLFSLLFRVGGISAAAFPRARGDLVFKDWIVYFYRFKLFPSLETARRRRIRLRLVTSRGPPYPSRSPRAHPSGWTRTQYLLVSYRPLASSTKWQKEQSSGITALGRPKIEQQRHQSTHCSA